MIFDYIIIGAGIAGLYTVYNLKKKFPNKTFLILEANKKKYIGGRIHQEEFSNRLVTTGAGVGDIVPTTDLERAFFCFMINSGDIIFALVFGLINNMVLSNRMDDDTGNFINSMVRTERCLAKFEISGIWKDRIEQFYTY
jgi:hypothetical protein